MSIDTTVGGNASESYVTVAEADIYVEARYDGTDLGTEWDALDEEPKEYRLKLGALILNTFAWRGAKASRNQRLDFPRWWRWDDGYPLDEDTYEDYADITDYTPPTVPDEAKDAQCELSLQVVHEVILKAETMAFPEREIRSFGLGGSLEIEFSPGSPAGFAINKARVTSLSIVDYLLSKWLATFSGGIV